MGSRAQPGASRKNAFAVVVGAHDQQHVGDGDDEGHRPEDQRDDPEDVLRGHLDRVGIGRVEDGLFGVQRAGADVAEDDAEGTDREGHLGSSAPVHGPTVPDSS
jgi:hypothetical protein